MNQRVVLVSNSQAAGSDLANLLLGTYVGLGFLMYGLYWLTGNLTPKLLSLNLGILTYIVAPLAILLCIFFLMYVLACAISFEDRLSQLFYSGFFSYLVVPFIVDFGLVGNSDAGKIISYLLIFGIVFGLFVLLMKYRKVLITAKVIGGVVIFGFILIPFWRTTINIIRAAGWL